MVHKIRKELQIPKGYFPTDFYKENNKFVVIFAKEKRTAIDEILEKMKRR